MMVRSVITHLLSAGIFLLPLHPAIAAVNAKSTGQIIDDVVDQMSEQKTALGTLYAMKSQVSEKDFKFLEKKISGFQGVPAPKIKHTDTNQITISTEGKTITMEVLDVEKGQFKIGRQRVDLPASMPIADKWNAVEARMKGSFSSSWIPSLIPEAHADPLVGGTIAIFYGLFFAGAVTMAKGCDMAGQALQACTKMRAEMVDSQVLGTADLGTLKKMKKDFETKSHSYGKFICVTGTWGELDACRRDALAKLNSMITAARGKKAGGNKHVSSEADSSSEAEESVAPAN